MHFKTLTVRDITLKIGQTEAITFSLFIFKIKQASEECFYLLKRNFKDFCVIDFMWDLVSV